jgi:hypothetical protein
VTDDHLAVQERRRSGGGSLLPEELGGGLGGRPGRLLVLTDDERRAAILRAHQRVAAHALHPADYLLHLIPVAGEDVGQVRV